jgi:DNA-binding transcriptional MerR regulator
MNPLTASEAARSPEKSPDAFRTITEVADDLDVPQHVLRFWETRFPQIKPLKRGGGRRYYRPDDVDLLKGIRHLLYGEGYTIKGVQRILKEDGLRFVQGVGRGERVPEAPRPAENARALLAPESRPERVEDSDAEEADEEPLRHAGPNLRSSPAAARSSAPALAPASLDLGKLREALDELLECERVLAALKPPGASEDEPG